MSFVNFWVRCLLLACLLATGCSPATESNSSNSAEEGGGAAAPAAGSAAKKKIVPVKRDVKDLVGNWVMVITSNRSDNYRWLVKFSRGADGKFSSEFIDSLGDKEGEEKAVIESSDIDGDSVKFQAKAGPGVFEFSGRFQQGFVRGTIRSVPGEPLLCRLLPTDEKSLSKFAPTGKPPGSDVFEGIMKSKEFKPEMLLGALHEFSTSPLAQDLYSTLVTNYGQLKIDNKILHELIAGYESSSKLWGPQWEARAELAIGISLVKGREFSREGLVHLEAAEKLLAPDLQAYQPTIDAFRDGAKTFILVQDLGNDSSTNEVKEASFKELTEAVKKQPFNAEILNALANYAQKTGQVDTAIEYLSQIVAYPLLEGMVIQFRAGLPPDAPLPNDLLKKLWTEKHGSEEGYAAHIEALYHKMVDELTAEMQKQIPPVEEEKLGNKCILVEMFTGMQCPPCVAADFGVMGISHTYSTKHVAALRYHQHIPLPDGLCNQDSEERAAFYAVASTPSLAVDGVPIDPRFFAGYVQNSTSAYSVLRRLIDPRVVEKADVALNLKAEVNDGQLTVSADVTGIAEDQIQACRLYMAVVENKVKSFLPLSNNGIREHEYVVREMLGGAKGIPAKKKELKYTVSIPLADINQHIIDYIDRFEAGRRVEFPPELRPEIKGPLSVIAWVQNGNVDKETGGKMVLQTEVVQLATPSEVFTNSETPKTEEKPAADVPAAAASEKKSDKADSPAPPAKPE